MVVVVVVVGGCGGGWWHGRTNRKYDFTNCVPNSVVWAVQLALLSLRNSQLSTREIDYLLGLFVCRDWSSFRKTIVSFS